MPRKRRLSKKAWGDDSDDNESTLARNLSSEGSNVQITESTLTSAQWTTLRDRVQSDQEKRSLSEVFGKPAKRGAIYRWGRSTAMGKPCDEATHWLTRMATGARTRGKRFSGVDPQVMLQRFLDSLDRRESDLLDANEVVLWTAAMPSLLNHLDETQWWSLLGAIQDFRDGLLHRDPTQPVVLVGVAEVGLTLAWCLRALPSCRRLAVGSTEALRKWCEQDDLAISAILNRHHESRLALASLLRTRMLLTVVDHEKRPSKKQKRTAKQNSKKTRNLLRPALDEIGMELATWVTALTRHGGVQSFADVSPDHVQSDVGKLGLLTHSAALDPAALVPAMKASLGEGRSDGRLAWQVSLPESMLHDENAKLACMLPEWDVRRGRMAIDYASPTMQLEMTAGKSTLISGGCETHISVDGRTIAPLNGWVATCEYSDDDVHYLEFEQPHEEGFVLQRQVMLIREDRCCFLADAVIEGSFQMAEGEADGGLVADERTLPLIEYQIRLPFNETVTAELEPNTNDLFLRTGRRQAMVLPISAGEWRNAPADSTGTHLNTTKDQHLLLTSRGRGQLYTPLWFDLSRPRFSKQRTWRRLTVAQKLNLMPSRLASAFRIQIGSTQWVLYRSMAPPVPRTFMGRHLIADFYCARFDAKEESYEDLITVEDSPARLCP